MVESVQGHRGGTREFQSICSNYRKLLPTPSFPLLTVQFSRIAAYGTSLHFRLLKIMVICFDDLSLASDVFSRCPNPVQEAWSEGGRRQQERGYVALFRHNKPLCMAFKSLSTDS